MNTHNKRSREHQGLTLVDAVETLSNIADLNLEREIAITEKHDVIVDDRKVTYRTIHWLNPKTADVTIQMVKETFRVILRYLQHFYRKEYGYLTDTRTIEGIKTIMVLVGEAAKKLDKYTTQFNGAKGSSVTELPEYRHLQEFYHRRIARKIDEGVLGKWILALGVQPTERIPEVKKLVARQAAPDVTKHIYIDLDTVKKDTEYELLFMRKEDGSRFYNPRLLRNIMLVCDFGDYFSDRDQQDPLSQVAFWQDRVFYSLAKSIVKRIHTPMERYFKEVARFKDKELVASLNKTISALLLATDSRNLLSSKPVKSCGAYFADFQLFLRESLSTHDYHKLEAYPPRSTNKLGHCLLDLIYALCEGVICCHSSYQEFKAIIVNMVVKARQAAGLGATGDVEGANWWEVLDKEYAAVCKLLKSHPNGPLVKVLDLLQMGIHQTFDPFLQHNVPARWYDLWLGENKITNIRMACPIRQDMINRATVTDEFKVYLRELNRLGQGSNHLIVNLQDRTSWREHSRCAVIENLQHQKEFEKVLNVVTLATDTEFYNQLPPYHQLNHADAFMKQFKEHLEGDSSGFYFPPSLHKKLFPHFIDNMTKAVHKIFFASKNVLVRQDRLDFIEICYAFIILKILDVLKPDSFSLSCKDGVDIGSASNALLCMLLKILSQTEETPEDVQALHLMLHAAPVLIRERPMLPDRYHRVASAMKTLALGRADTGHEELIHSLKGYFKGLFDSPIWDVKIAYPIS